MFIYLLVIQLRMYLYTDVLESSFFLLLFQALRTLFHIEGATFFKKGQLQSGLKQLNLEENPC